jgi:ATP-binding cassette subfamily F protein 3
VALAADRAGTREQVFRDFLGGFDFRGDRVGAPVQEFSGGERRA